MGRITDFIIVETKEQYVLIIERTIKEAEIIHFIVDSVHKLNKYTKEFNCLPSDFPFLRILDANPVKVAVGVITPEKINGNEFIISEKIDAGKKAVGYYQGDNNNMESFYNEIKEFVNENGFKTKGAGYEFFLNGIEFGIDKLLTKVVFEIE